MRGWAMGRILFFLTLMLFAGSAARAENLTPRAFTEAAAATARAAMPSAQVTVAGDLHLETRSAAGEEITTDLHNAYETYLRAPERRDDIIRSYIGVLVEAVTFGDAKTPLDRSRIVPVLKPLRWVDSARQVQREAKVEPKPEIVTDAFNSELAIVYAEDRPQSMRYLTTRDDTGDRAKLRHLALGNLHRLLPKIEMREGADHIFLVEAGGNYEASLLLADGIWSSGQIKVDGDPVVAVPRTDALLVTGSRNRAGIAHLRGVGAKLAGEPHGLTPALFVYRDGKFVKFEGD
jgi:uncharacterized protein YtpQ (UPF0354 family)